ncbi:MFS transporter [Faecalicatena orotica]|uniref:Na+/melibiose symporter-like transporter n=1 Tax=Faecalicatena orotica TaxID=1544 RepID=A0A2Y9BMJ4_9FIRM|nr:MFS transporter [Faecalicatena orotica]PWJ22577.1 Na+/melibiose symporter-like transporter [Faecalicatena orotica]SSA58246.1 Na+/melibiose symporter [Faecalicatena orotica]
MTKEKKQKNPDKLGLGRLLAFKSSDVAQAGIQAIVLGYLTLYCTDTLAINPALVGTLLMASKIIDAFTDIFAGWLVDNTHTKLGKGRPYELCIIGVMICSIGLFSASPQWTMFFKCAWIFSMYTLVFSIFTTLRMAALTPYTIRAFSNNQNVITKVASYGGIITMGASIAINTVFPIVMSKLATSASGWTKTMAIFAIPLLLIGLLRFFLIKEDPSVDAGQQHQKVSMKEIFTMFKTNKYVWLYACIMLCYNVITALGVATYYFKWVIGNTALMAVTSMFSIITLPLMLLFPIIMKKIGTMGNMISLFSVIGIGGYVVVFFSNNWLPGVLAGGMLAAFATLPLAYYGVLFIMKCCTYNEMNDLPRMDGSSTILSNFMSKLGAAAGSAITGALLGIAGYVAGDSVASQPGSAIMMIRVLYAIVPAILLVVIAICSKKFVVLEKKIPVWEEEKKKQAGKVNAE